LGKLVSKTKESKMLADILFPKATTLQIERVELEGGDATNCPNIQSRLPPMPPGKRPA
jgi:hypothetical protein